MLTSRNKYKNKVPHSFRYLHFFSYLQWGKHLYEQFKLLLVVNELRLLCLPSLRWCCSTEIFRPQNLFPVDLANKIRLTNFWEGCIEHFVMYFNDLELCLRRHFVVQVLNAILSMQLLIYTAVAICNTAWCSDPESNHVSYKALSFFLGRDCHFLSTAYFTSYVKLTRQGFFLLFRTAVLNLFGLVSH